MWTWGLVSRIVLLALLWLGSAQAQATASLVLGQDSGVPGDTVGLTLTLHYDEPLSALQTDIHFDPNLFSGASLVPSPPAGAMLESELLAPGHLRLVLYSLACPGIPVAGAQADLATLQLTIAADANAGTTSVTLDQANFAAVGGTAATSGGLIPGQVTILGQPGTPAVPVPTGNWWGLLLLGIGLLALGIFVLRRYGHQVKLLLVVGIALYTASYTGLSLAGGGPGDANADGVVDNQDAVLIAEVILGRATAIGNADCNGDGLVNALDIACVVDAACDAEPNQAPSLAPITDQLAGVGQTFQVDAEAADPDAGDSLSFSLDQAPVGMVIDATTGLILWTPAAADVGNHNVVVRVTDSGALFDTESFVITVNQAPPGNHPPTLAAVANQSLREDRLLTLGLQATDPDAGDVVTFSLVSAPVGMSLDASTGNLLWAPSASQVGNHPVTVRALDPHGAFDEGGFEVTVSRLGGPPTLAAIADQTTEEGTEIAADANATDPDLPGDTLTYSLTLAPSGASIDPATGAIAWTPSGAQVGAHDFTVRVEDSEGLVDFASFIVTVSTINAAPVANDDVYVVRQGETLTVAAAGFMDNDSDPNSDPLVAELLTSPSNGDLFFQTDGSFTYEPRNPDTVVVTPNFDLTEHAGAVPNASSDATGVYSLASAIDGNLDTSWLSVPADRSAFYEVTFANPATVREIRYFGNRLSPLTALDYTAGTFTLYDASGTELWASGDVTLPAPDRDIVLDITALAGAPVANVSRVRFDVTGYEATGGYHGFAELQVIGDGVVAGLGLEYKWGWPSLDPAVLPTVEPTYINSNGSPVVCDLDRNGMPEVMFGTFVSSSGTSSGVLRVVSGLDGSPLFTIVDPDPASSADPGTASSAMYTSHAALACGEIDGESLQREIILVGNSNELIALEHDGSFKWAADYSGISGPALVDIDGDGTTEVVAGYNSGVVVLNGEDGSEVWTAQGGSANISYGHAPLVADVDLDGSPDVVAGNTVYSATGAVLWQNTSLPDRANGIGNFDEDAFAEIVLVYGGDVYLLEHDLSIKWGPMTIPGGGSGGPPTVADFDGDGLAEIGVAGATRYVVFDTDGSILWQATIQDGSSNITGSTVFDFENDGIAEVVYRDEVNLWIFRGTDGAVIGKEPMGSGTWIEYPVVADIDADGHAEILIGANNYYGNSYLPNHGFFAFGGFAGNWVRAREIWNQYNYQVTNVLADGSIPTHEQPNWLTPGLNNFRQNAFLPGEAARADQFTYRVSDGSLNSATATVSLDIRPPNTAPAIISQPDRSATAGFQYLYDVVATDVDADSLSFALVDAPTGMTIDVNTGLVRWSPATAEIGNHSATVSVTDDDGFSDVQAWQITVAQPLSVPDVIGQTQAAAESAISAAGLVTGVVSQAHHATVPVGQVFSQSPPGGSAAEPDSDVDIVISTGAAPEDIDDDGDGPTENDGDCDDTNPSIYPGAPEVGGDGIDQDCDGADAHRPIDQVVVQPASLTLGVGQSFDLVAHGVFADGSGFRIDQQAAWTSSDAAVASVDNQGLVQALAAGTAMISASFEGKSDSASIEVIFVDPADNDPPTAEITSPEDGAEVLSPTQVIGSAADPNLLRWELSVAPADSDTFTQIAGGTTPVNDGLLGTLDPTLMLNDLYQLRLQVFDAGLNVSTFITTVLIKGQQKVGNFTLSFVDLQIPVSGIPITVNRTYDSRDKRRGDFGVGWRLGIQSLDLTCTTPLGEGWYVVHSGLSFGLVSTRLHSCALRLANGDVEVFDFTPTPNVSALVTFPFGSINSGFTPRPGTTGSLQALGDGVLSIFDPQPGPVSLFLSDTSVYNPSHFRYSQPDGSVIEFGPSGMASLTDANGNSLSFSPTSITHSSGKSITFTRDALGRITTLVDPMGHTQTYQYSAADDLVAHTDAAGYTTRFFYNNEHGIVRIEDPLGRDIARAEYDDDGRLIAMTDALGNTTEFHHDLVTRTETTVFADGASRVERYDESGNIIEEVDADGVVMQYSWTDYGQLSSVINSRGSSEHFDYDQAGRLVSIRHASGAEFHATLNQFGKIDQVEDALGNVTSYDYDSHGNVVLITNAAGNQTSYAYDSNGELLALGRADGSVLRHEVDTYGLRTADIDALGHRTAYAYDANGSVLSRTTDIAGPSGPVTIMATARRDAMGRIVAVTDAEGNETTIERDFRGRPNVLVDPLGRRLEQSWNARGDLVEMTLPDGATSTREYNVRGFIERAVFPDGRTAGLSYTPAGSLSDVVWEDGTPADPNDNPSAHFALDDLGLLTSLEGSNGSTVHLQHRDDGLLASRQTGAQQINFEYDLLDRPIAEIDSAGRRTEILYDDFGRVLRRTFPDGSFVSHAYDALGRLIRTVDEEGRATEMEYDLAGRLTLVRDALGNETHYGWGPFGHLVSQVDANGRTTSYQYSPGGKRVALIRPNGSRIAFEYDTVGNLVKRVDADAREVRWQYNAHNLPVQRVVDGNTFEATYDAMGRRLSADDPRGTVEFQYDNLGRVVLQTEPTGAFIRHTHDATGNVSSIETPSGIVRYEWDTLNRLSRVIDRDGESWLHEYDALGRLYRVSSPNLVQEREFDLRDRVTRTTYRDGSGTVLLRYDTDYDRSGRITSAEDLAGNQVEFEYDAAGRLAGVHRSGAFADDIQFILDPVANMLSRVSASEGTTTFEYDSTDRLIEKAGPDGETTLAYDLTGRMTSAARPAGVTAYQWSSDGRLIGATDGAGDSSHYVYDWDGLLVKRSADTELDLLWDRSKPLAQLLEERPSVGTALPFTYGATPLSQGLGASKQRFALDQHSGVRALVGTAGVNEHLDYAAYGKSLTGLGTSRLGYRGEWYESMLGTMYLRARHYDPDLQRFLSPDPFAGVLAEPLTRQDYLYAKGDPINFSDPSGRFAIATVVAGLVAFGIVNAFQYAFLQPVGVRNHPEETNDWHVKIRGGSIELLLGISPLILEVDSTCKPGENRGEIRDAGYYTLLLGFDLGAKVGIVFSPDVLFKTRASAGFRQSLFEGFASLVQGPQLAFFVGGSTGGVFNTGDAYSAEGPGWTLGNITASLASASIGYTWGQYGGNGHTFYANGCND